MIYGTKIMSAIQQHLIFHNHIQKFMVGGIAGDKIDWHA